MGDGWIGGAHNIPFKHTTKCSMHSYSDCLIDDVNSFGEQVYVVVMSQWGLTLTVSVFAPVSVSQAWYLCCSVGSPRPITPTTTSQRSPPNVPNR